MAAVLLLTDVRPSGIYFLQCIDWFLGTAYFKWQYFTGVTVYILSDSKLLYCLSFLRGIEGNNLLFAAILCLRLYAMYRRNTTMLIFLAFCLLATTFSMCIVYITYFKDQVGRQAILFTIHMEIIRRNRNRFALRGFATDTLLQSRESIL